MSNCKECLSEQVCRYNDGINLYCKDDYECPHYKTADVVEVESIAEKIIRKKAEVSDYWQKNVKSYRATQGYADIEHDTDNFLRGYNEAAEDILAIIDGGQTTIECKYCINEICVNADCNMYADYCPIPDEEEVCRYEERTPKERGVDIG